MLSALNTNYGLRYRGAVPLEARVTGTHAGSLREVVRLLKGCDYVLINKGGAFEVLVIRATEGQTATPHS